MLTWHTGEFVDHDYLLSRYLLTFCTDSRRHLLIDRERVDLVLEQILRAACDEQFATAAYCFLPDRVHLLVEAQSASANHRRFVSRAKQFSADAFMNTFGFRLWQRQGFERMLRADEATLTAARDVLESPVRAGLAASAEDYPFGGSGVYRLADILSAAVGGTATQTHRRG